MDILNHWLSQTHKMVQESGFSLVSAAMCSVSTIRAEQPLFVFTLSRMSRVLTRPPLADPDKFSFLTSTFIVASELVVMVWCADLAALVIMSVLFVIIPNFLHLFTGQENDVADGRLVPSFGRIWNQH